MQGWAKKIHPHLIVCSADYVGGLPAIQLSARLGIPYAYIMQANSESWWPSDLLRTSMNTAIDAAKGAIFFVSSRNRELFELQLGRSLHQAFTCHNPHGAEGLSPLPWPTSKIHDCASLRLACVGRLEPVAKGQDLILQALALPQWSARSWNLSFYGSGHGVEGVKAMAKMLGIDNRLSFIPAYNALVDVWLDRHALVLPSRYEGLPLALVEAMWLGRPALVTDVADSALLLRDGVDGFVAESPTVKHVAAALERLWEQRDHLAEMGVSASDRVRTYVPSDPVATTSEQILGLIEH
jgi:glycosyltransferase involved in cell wall biosynthesis